MSSIVQKPAVPNPNRPLRSTQIEMTERRGSVSYRLRLRLTAVAPGTATLRVLLPVGGASTLAAHAAAPAATLLVHVGDDKTCGGGGSGGGAGAGVGGGSGGLTAATVTPREARLAVSASTTFAMATPADSGSLLQVRLRPSPSLHSLSSDHAVELVHSLSRLTSSL